jgi:hypothetical protein
LLRKPDQHQHHNQPVDPANRTGSKY